MGVNLNVNYTPDVKLDLQHRDFACHAVYYDLIDNAFIDLGGAVN